MQNDVNSIRLFERSFGSWKLSLTREALSEKQISGAYDRVAPEWTRKLNRLGVPGFYHSIWHQLRSQIDGEGSHRNLQVLDCGIGDGAFSTALIDTLDVHPRLFGVDLSEEMLGLAERALLQHSNKASLSIGDAQHLMFEDRSFDLVISAHMLEHLSQPQRAIKEIFRVLKPRGATVLVVTKRSLLGRLIQWKWRTQVFDPSEFERLLRSVGFEDIQFVRPPTFTFSDGAAIVCLARRPSAQPNAR